MLASSFVLLAPPAVAAPALVVVASPCHPGSDGSCRSDPTSLAATWPDTEAVGSVVVAWDGSGRPAGSPAPATADSVLATGSGTCSQAGEAETCSWPWPSSLDGPGAQVLDGTYAVTACSGGSATASSAPRASAGTPAVSASQVAPITLFPPPPTSPASTTTTTPAPPTTAGPTTSAPSATTTTTVPPPPASAGCKVTDMAPATVGVGVAPLAPAALVATGGGSVTLRWAPNPEDDLGGYRVARDGVEVWACSAHAAPGSSNPCPAAPGFADTGAASGTHTYSVTALRYPASPGAALLTSAPSVVGSAVTGSAAPLPTFGQGPVSGSYHLVTPAGPAGTGGARVPVTTLGGPPDSGYQADLPYGSLPGGAVATASGTGPARSGSPAAEDGPAQRPSVDHAALVAAGALLIAIAAHLRYLAVAAGRRVAGMAVATGAAEGPGSGAS